MISFILSSRVKNNQDTAIGSLLDSVSANVSKPSNVEFLIKYDDDDDQRPSDDFFKKYPFDVRTFTWSRGEGRHALHWDHTYLFTQHHPLAKFVIIASDDFIFTRKNFDLDILSIKDEFAFVGQTPLDWKMCSGNLFEPNTMRYWVNNGWANCLPCMTVRTVEVLSGFGYHASEDNWQTLLIMLLYQEYGISHVYKVIPPYYERNRSNGQSSFSPTFNEFEITGAKVHLPAYYYELVRQQAHNLYLNIQEKEVSDRTWT